MRLHVGGHSYLLHQTISSLEERLDPQMFVRLHRSHIVRRDQIAGADKRRSNSTVVVATSGAPCRGG